MGKQRIALYRSRLGFRLLGVILLAILLAVGVGAGISRLGKSAVNSAIFNNLFQDMYIDEMLGTFQEYVNANRINSTDYLKVMVWMSENTGVSFLYDAGSGQTGEYSIRFADKTVSVIPYVSSTQYSGIIQIAALLAGFACFLLVVLPFIRKIISDIKHLSHDMETLSGGDLTHRVQLKRTDELGELALAIDTMRNSVIYRMERENEALKANQDLITALSHDLRTPLTKQMGYLELAIQGKYQDEAAMRECLNKVYRAAGQIKSLSDELFSYFLAFGSTEKKQPMLEEIDGMVLLSQMLEGQAAFLHSKGFQVEEKEVTDAFMLRVNIPWLARIIDNLVSNILRYADHKQPVKMYYVLNREQVFIHFENAVRMDLERREGTNIGVRSAEKLAQDMNGALHTESVGSKFFAILQLPVYSRDI
ncbi:MAG TPA: histidine kinase dimerization/phospho-acceptor domain-containing protein [Feifaniaceae bacterium]|nr:histidine kinase dimerization/phospho-acceptor domain-containing protein [Feifaniaceae bacterium]